jgi:hypothetical protein
MHGVESKRRGRSPEESLSIFQAMIEGTEEGLKNCIRYKMDMQVGGGVGCGGVGGDVAGGWGGGGADTSAGLWRVGRCGGAPLLHPAPPDAAAPPRRAPRSPPSHPCRPRPGSPQNPNKALRDPVTFRCNLTHHWRTGHEYKVWGGGGGGGRCSGGRRLRGGAE